MWPTGFVAATILKPSGPTLKLGPIMGLDSVWTELDKKLEEIEIGIDAEGFDFEIVEEEFFP